MGVEYYGKEKAKVLDMKRSRITIEMDVKDKNTIGDMKENVYTWFLWEKIDHYVLS